MTSIENLPAALAELRDAHYDLCSPRTDGEGHWAPSLYEQLADAIDGVDGAGVYCGRSSRPPVWMPAMVLRQEIDERTREWHPEPVAGEPVAVARLRALLDASWRPQDAEHVREIAYQVRVWVRQINQLLYPEQVKHIRTPDGDGFAACPQCGTRTIRRFDESDQQWTTVPVLQWRVNAGTTCLACQAHWGVEHTLWLGRVLGFELPAGVLE